MLMHEHAAERARTDGTADRFDLGHASLHELLSGTSTVCRLIETGGDHTSMQTLPKCCPACR